MSSSSVAPSPATDVAQPGPETIQRLIDQVAGFNLFVVPDGSNSPGGNGTTGIVQSETLHRFEVTLQRPTEQGLQAVNALGEAVGKVEIRWFFIPDSFM